MAEGSRSLRVSTNFMGGIYRRLNRWTRVRNSTTPPDLNDRRQSEDASQLARSVDICIHAHRHIYTQGNMHASNTLIN